MAISIEQLVQREVICCMSSLVSTLAQGYSDCHETKDLNSLCEQAYDLAAPVPDYEEAAIQAGWRVSDDGTFFYIDKEGETRNDVAADPRDACGWEDLCNECDIAPYNREVYEHWAVSPWLADKLIDQGEKVDSDFANLCVWARTTTGQMIAADCVIERIHAALVTP